MFNFGPGPTHDRQQRNVAVTRTKWLILTTLLLLAGVLWWFFGDYIEFQVIDAVATAEDFFLTKTHLDSDGKIPDDPSTLAAAAGTDLDTYALARMMRSEMGILGVSAMTAVGFATLRAASGSIASKLLYSTGPGNGFFGPQGGAGGIRYASTSTDPSPDDILLATQVSTGQIADNSQGATQWDSPWSYGTSARADAVAQTRMKAGSTAVYLDDVPQKKLRLWVPGG